MNGGHLPPPRPAISNTCGMSAGPLPRQTQSALLPHCSTDRPPAPSLR